MKISLIADRSKNNIIGNGADIPWSVKGEQLLFKAMTYNNWILVGRKTFESMGVLANRKYAVISRSPMASEVENVKYFRSIDDALNALAHVTDSIFVCGGGQLYASTINIANHIHLSTIDVVVQGDIVFPSIPLDYKIVFEERYKSNRDYVYQLYTRTNDLL